MVINKQEQKNNGLSDKERNFPKKEKQNSSSNKSKTKNKKIIENKNNNYIDKNNIIQLISSNKIINEISFNQINNRNSLKNIISRNRHFSKSKNKELQKDNKKLGRKNLQDYNYFYTTTNSNGGYSNIINKTLNNKCNTSRNKKKKDKIKNITNNSQTIHKVKNINRNIHNSDINVCNPKSLYIKKKSLINSLLNSNKDMEIKKRIRKSNSRTLLNNNNINNKTSVNAYIFESITKNSLNNSKNKHKKELISLKNLNDNNESEYIYIKNKNNRHLFSGLAKINNHKQLYKRKNNELSSYYIKKIIKQYFY